MTLDKVFMQLLQVPTNGEIKYFYASIISTPDITTIFTIIVVDLPLAYGIILGSELSFPLA